MGNEALCRVELDGAAADAKVLLETDELIVRGAMKVRIPFAEITSLDADGDALRVAWNGRRCTIALGAQSEKWAEKIRNPKSVADKLGVRAGQRVSLLGEHDASFVSAIEKSGADVVRTPRSDSHAIFFATANRSELAQLATLRNFLVPAGALWVVRPKGVTTIAESDVLDAGRAAELVDVKVVRISATLTGEKFVVRRQNRG
jgi:hypothetical protein